MSFLTDLDTVSWFILEETKKKQSIVSSKNVHSTKKSAKSVV